MATIINGWLKTRETKTSITNKHIRVSVIIAARNEEKSIENCLYTIINQNYPKEFIEIIVVDDNSTDETKNCVQKLSIKNKNIKLIELHTFGLSGKKQALNTAIKESKGDLIITTDADCITSPLWINNIVNCYLQTDAKMIVGPVMFQKETSIFEKLQSLELIALIASTAGSLFYNKATMCNGANLAYTKEAFYEVEGFQSIENIPSGDDVLLMYKIQKRFSKGIIFLKSRDSIVFTKAQTTLRSFVNQRIRWASKNISDINATTKILGAIVFIFNLYLFLLLILSIVFYVFNFPFYLQISLICLIIYGIKCFIDFLLLFLASGFFGKQKHLIYFLPEQFIYPFYIIVIGLLGMRKKYTWKDRTFNGKA